jgi:hypothetical protein
MSDELMDREASGHARPDAARPRRSSSFVVVLCVLVVFGMVRLNLLESRVKRQARLIATLQSNDWSLLDGMTSSWAQVLGMLKLQREEDDQQTRILTNWFGGIAGGTLTNSGSIFFHLEIPGYLLNPPPDDGWQRDRNGAAKPDIPTWEL